MNKPWIIDAHLHIGSPGLFFTPIFETGELLKLMDQIQIRLAVCCDHLSVSEGAGAGLDGLMSVYEESHGRIFYLAVYDPRRPEDLKTISKAARKPGFAGLKFHPSFHRTPAEDPRYEPAWKFAAEYDVAVLTHSWSVSEYNSSQRYSTPERFENYIRKYPSVRFVLGHAGGRGTGRHDVVRLTNEYPNVYTDIAGDIFCNDLIESLVRTIPDNRILFGSDFPWLDPRANLTRVFLADISTRQKKNILCDNANHVYQMGRTEC